MGCRFGRWPTGMVCIGARCARRWSRRSRRRARRRSGVAPRLAPFRAAIDEMLRSDLDAPKKQRHTARRVLARLVDEHDAVGLSYSSVRDYVRTRRPQILAEAGKPLELGFVPQTHEPGVEGEVDFHDL